MRDYYSVNLRARELHDALHAVESSKRDAARTAALGKLRKVLAKEVELLQQENEPVLVQHVGPLEKRAQELLVDSPKEGAAKDGATKDPPPKK